MTEVQAWEPVAWKWADFTDRPLAWRPVFDPKTFADVVPAVFCDTGPIQVRLANDQLVNVRKRSGG